MFKDHVPMLRRGCGCLSGDHSMIPCHCAENVAGYICQFKGKRPFIIVAYINIMSVLYFFDSLSFVLDVSIGTNCATLDDCHKLRGEKLMIMTNPTYNWYDARDHCQEYGGDLALVDSIANLSRDSRPLYYVGLHKEIWLPFDHEEGEGNETDYCYNHIFRIVHVLRFHAVTFNYNIL